MEFEKEFVEQNQLSPEQVTAITEKVSSHINSELGSKVHEHTETNLGKIWGSVKEVTGIDRNQGEKYADAIKRATDLHFKTTKENLELQKTQLQEKIANTKGDETLKQELESVKEQLDGYKQKAATFEEWEKADYKGKYEQANTKLSTMEKRIAFNSVTPAKPENVNEYEWNAKWKEWQGEILEKNNLVFDEEGTAWAVDKENEFKKEKLSSLARQNETLQSLLKGREQKGLNSQQKKVSVEGLPFDIPENASRSEIQKLIKEYLAENRKDLKQFSPQYSTEYAKLNQISLGLGKKQADK